MEALKLIVFAALLWKASALWPRRRPDEVAEYEMKDDSVCDVETTGGNGNGACCQFPFTYQGTEYNKCIENNHGQLWCGTKADSSQWGNCVDGCWIRKIATRVPSKNLEKLQSKSLDQCQDLCAKHPLCVAIEFYHNRGGTNSSYWKEGGCWLNSGAEVDPNLPKNYNCDVYIDTCKKGCWTRKIATRVPSKNLEKLRSKSLEQCQDLCARNPLCLSIEFYHNRGGTNSSHWKEGGCWLNSGAEVDPNLPKNYNSDVYIDTCKKGCWIRKIATRVPSKNLKKLQSKSLEKCQYLCARHPLCVAIEFYHYRGGTKSSTWKEGGCWLNSGAEVDPNLPKNYNCDVYINTCKKGVSDNTILQDAYPQDAIEVITLKALQDVLGIGGAIKDAKAPKEDTKVNDGTIGMEEMITADERIEHLAMKKAFAEQKKK